MAHKLTRKELVKQDEFVEAAPDIVDWFERHRRVVIQIVVVVAVVGVVLGGWTWWSDRQASTASAALAEGLRAYRPLPQGAEAPPAPRLDAALAAFETAARAGGGSPTGLVASFYRASALVKLGRAGEAVPILRDVASRTRNRVLADSARGVLAQALEASGDADGAAAVLRDMANAADATIPADVTLARLASLLQKQGKTAEARQTWQDIVTRFPQSATANEARNALAGLAPQ